jgi:hypothetical protein
MMKSQLDGAKKHAASFSVLAGVSDLQRNWSLRANQVSWTS